MDINTIRDQMMTILEGPDRINRLADLSEQYLGNGLFFMDASWNVMAASKGAAKDDLLVRLNSRKDTEFRKYSIEVTKAIESGRLEPFIIKGKTVGRTRLIAKALWDDRYVGHVTILEQKIPLAKLDLALVRLVQQMLALVIQLDKAAGFPEQERPWSSFVRHMLSGRISTRAEFELRLQTNTTLYLPEKIRVVCIQSRSNNIDHHTFHRMETFLLHYQNIISCILFEGNAVLLCDVSEKDMPLSINSPFGNFALQNSLCIGVSSSFSDLFEIPGFYHDAQRASLFVRRWYVQCPIQTYDSCKLNDLLMNVRSPTKSLHYYVAEGIWNMLAEDDKKGG
ncbi:MAG: hypothetical protein LBB68_09555 [Treponema sp.]|jgi:hypothetical protein|nr:hypothetical protein [Treponema sp.]